MPRKARIDAPGALQHIICRGIERRRIFWTDEDRDDFLQRLATVLVETQTPCYAWALMPNHFHLLVRTGNAPVAQLMRRLLSGYAGNFNRRHHRCGLLFYNRYKSILCQEDPYFLELIRYIHLNPLRAKLAATLDELDHFSFSGHSVLIGNSSQPWQSVDAVLRLFGKRASAARMAYRQFVEKGIALGRRKQLSGGGLIRSLGGWDAVKEKRRSREHIRGDERILGDSDFVEAVLAVQNERMERCYALSARGYDFQAVVRRAGEVLGIDENLVLLPGKQPQRVQARDLVCYWAVRELGMRTVAVARLLSLTQPAVSQAVCRGERFSRAQGLELIFSEKRG